MSNLIAVSDWLGHHGEPLHPESMQYSARPAKSCRGCLFEGQRSAVCDRAIVAALRVDLPHCELDGCIYVAREVDPRQLAIKTCCTDSDSGK